MPIPSTIRSQTTLIGLDRGATGVRAVQLRLVRGTWQVAHVACREFAHLMESDGSLDACSADEITRQCVRSEPFRGRRVAVALPPGETKYHALELPVAAAMHNENTARDIARVEVGRLMTATPETIEVDHWMLPGTSAAGPNAIGLGVRSDVVTNALSVCQRAGLSCVCADTSALALQRWGCALHRWGARQIWGMLDLGHTSSRLVLSLGTTPVLIRDVGGGGQTWTRRIAETLQIGEKAAEIQKREHGIVLSGRGLRSGDQAPPNSELAGIIFGALHHVLEELAGEIKRSYEYILSHYGIEEASDLMLVGGGAGMRNLSSYLGQLLGIDAKRAGDYGQDSPFPISLTSGGGTSWERLALAIGLAIHGKESTREH